MLSHFTGAEENLSKSTTHLPVSKPASQASPKRLPEYERARRVWNVEWNIFFPLRFNSQGEFAEKKEKKSFNIFPFFPNCMMSSEMPNGMVAIFPRYFQLGLRI